jgi:uracil-DNA glycosylase
MAVSNAEQPAPPEAPSDCRLCPRLRAFREENRKAHPDWFNDPVPSFGDAQGRLLIVGLAPGLKGANRTGRPFTGDYAGELLFSSLAKAGLARGSYGARADDGFMLVDCLITNAVRCVPPLNKPTGPEIATCNRFLMSRIAALPRLQTILALGRIAHEATLLTLGLKKRDYPFAHGARFPLPQGLVLFDSYHCSRQNTNTGRLTPAMFQGVLADIVAGLDAAPVLAGNA